MIMEQKLVKVPFGIDAGKETDFEVDGLRFAVFSNFS